MFPPKRGKSLGASSNDKNIIDMMNKVISDGTLATQEKFDWLREAVIDQNRLIEKRDKQLLTLDKENERLLAKVNDLNDQIERYRQQTELQAQELSESQTVVKEMARKDLAKEDFIKSVERSNKRLAEENASQSELIVSCAKRARLLTNVAKQQKEEIADLQTQVVLSESVLAAYEEEIMRCREERRQWELDTASESLEDENEKLRTRLARAIEMANNAESTVLTTRTSSGLRKAKIRVVDTSKGKIQGTEQRQKAPEKEADTSSGDGPGLPPVDIDPRLADEIANEPAEEPTDNGGDSDESTESDADEDEVPGLQSPATVTRAQDGPPKHQPQRQGGPTKGMQFESPKYQPWNMPSLRADQRTYGLDLQWSLHPPSSLPTYMPAYTQVGPQMDIGRLPLPSRMPSYTSSVRQSLPSHRAVSGQLEEMYGPGVQVSPFSGIPFGGSASRQSAFPSAGDYLSSPQRDLLPSLDEAAQMAEMEPQDDDEGRNSGESDNDDEESSSLAASRQMVAAPEASGEGCWPNKRRRMNDEPASLLSDISSPELPPLPAGPESQDEDMAVQGEVNGQGNASFRPAAIIGPIQQTSNAQDPRERQDEEMMLDGGAGDRKEEEMKYLLIRPDVRPASEGRTGDPESWESSFYASTKAPSSDQLSEACENIEEEDWLIALRHEISQDNFRAQGLSDLFRENMSVEDATLGLARKIPMSQQGEKKRKKRKLTHDESDEDCGEDGPSVIQALPVEEPGTGGATQQELLPPVRTSGESRTQTAAGQYQEGWCQTEEYPMASNGTQTEERPMVSNGVQTEYPTASDGTQTEKHPMVSRGIQTWQSWHASESGTQTEVVEAVAASSQTDAVPMVNAGAQTITVPASSGTRDTDVNTEASSQTDAVPTVEAGTQTIPLPAGSGTRNADTQTEERAVEVVVVEASGQCHHSDPWQYLWLSVILGLVLLISLWMSGRDRRMWLEANDVSRQTLVDIRDGASLGYPWLRMLNAEIAKWLEIDLVELG